MKAKIFSGMGIDMNEGQLVNKALFLRDKFNYELTPGIHTRQECPYCKERSTRAGKCFMCLIKEFANENM